MILAVVLLIGLNFRAMLGTFGSGAVAVAVVFVVALDRGRLRPRWTVSGRRGRCSGLGTGQRNIAAALVLATQNFPDEPGVMVMLLVSTLAGLVVILLAARRFAKSASLTRDAGTVDPVNGELVAVQARDSTGEVTR